MSISRKEYLRETPDQKYRKKIVSRRLFLCLRNKRPIHIEILITYLLYFLHDSVDNHGNRWFIIRAFFRVQESNNQNSRRSSIQNSFFISLT